MASPFVSAFRRNPRDGAIAAIAVPALGALAIDPLVTIVDTAWVARLGTVPLAAIAVAGAVFMAVFSVFNFVHVAVTPLVAGEVGRNDIKRAGSIATSAVLIGFAIGVALAIVFIALSDQVVGLFGSDPAVASEAESYLRVRFLALPPMIIATVGHGVYRGHQDTKTPLKVAVGMNIVNLVLDPLFIFTFGLGVVGAAWATVVAQTLAAAWFLVLMFGLDRTRLGIGRVKAGIRGLPIVEVLSAGWPMIVRAASLLAAITATTVAAARVGTASVAAHQIALQVWLFLSFTLDAYAVAAAAMIGKDLGAGKRPAARLLSHRLLALGLMTGIGLSILLFVTAPLIVSLFSLDGAVADELSSIYWFVIVLQPLTALVYVWDGIGVGASAFRYLAASMVVAGAASVITIVLVGDTLVGIWVGLAVLTLVRLVSLAGWYRWGKLSSGRDPSPASRAA
jgi:MATE family multidrug resistance protein